MVAGNYSAESGTYTAADMDDIAIDGLGTIGVVFVSFATLVGLVIAWNFIKKKAR